MRLLYGTKKSADLQVALQDSYIRNHPTIDVSQLQISATDLQSSTDVKVALTDLPGEVSMKTNM